MHSWGTGVDDTAQAELDRLLDTALRLAQSQLADAAHFEPVALVLADDGRILEIDQDRSALSKHPEVVEVLANAVRHLRQVRTEVRATALVVNTRLNREHTDAVEIRVEHRAGVAAIVLLPYKRATFGGRVDYATLSGFVGRPQVWV